jgi:hypothetical protein
LAGDVARRVVVAHRSRQRRMAPTGPGSVRKARMRMSDPQSGHRSGKTSSMRARRRIGPAAAVNGGEAQVERGGVAVPMPRTVQHGAGQGMVGCARVPPDRPVSPCQGRRLATKWVTHRPVAAASESARPAKGSAQIRGDRCRSVQGRALRSMRSQVRILTGALPSKPSPHRDLRCGLFAFRIAGW